MAAAHVVRLILSLGYISQVLKITVVSKEATGLMS